MSAFEELGVMPEIINSLDEMDWLLPTPVQMEAIPLILGGGDVAVAAETGSGKTGAFCVPILQIVYESRRTTIDNNNNLQQHSSSSSSSITLSSTDRGRNVAVDSEKNIAQSRHPVVWDGVRSSHCVCHGKWYFIGRIRDDGIGRIGWSSKHASLILGTDNRGFGYGATAMKSYDGKFDEYGSTFKKGDDICCMIEFMKCENNIKDCKVIVSFMKNNIDLGKAFEISFMQLGTSNLSLYPTFSMKNSEMEIDFEATNEHAKSLGFQPMRYAKHEDGVLSSKLLKLYKNSYDNKNDGDDSKNVGNSGKKEPLALILEPSRELAKQVYEEILKFRQHLPGDTTRSLLLTGGSDFKKDIQVLKTGCDIITGTLGSIMAHVKKGTVSLNSIRFFVLDEADTFATDNLKDIEFLHKKIPTRNNVQTLLFSATLHSIEIRSLSDKIQSFPTWVDLKGKESVPESLHHTMIHIDANVDHNLLNDKRYKHIVWPLDKIHDKDKGKDNMEIVEDAADERSYIIKKLKLCILHKVIDANNMNQAMIFVRSQLDGDNVESFLLQCSGISINDIQQRRFKRSQQTGPELEYSCAVLHGGRRQQERNEAFKAFKACEVRFLICTDVAARGLDIIGLPFLINLTLPDKSENYIHRVGRVGRAERLGLAISLVAVQKEAVWFHTCGKPKGGVCKRKRLVDDGGCVMWYDESKLLTEIEGRLKGRVEELGSTFKRKDENAGQVLYGIRIGEEEVFKQTRKHIESLQPAVRELMQMEDDAQASFFALQTEYSLT